ncbi:hypothetical protein ACI797_00350 [Geodermatophilus sp. SYSU D00691]
MSVPTPEAAAAQLAEADRAADRVRRETGPATAGFLATLGLASAGYFVAQPLAGADRGIAAATVVFVAAVAGAVWTLVAARRSAPRGFSHRFGLTMGAWAAVFAVGLAVGRTTLPEAWPFWLAGAVLVAVPCLMGAWRELPR